MAGENQQRGSECLPHLGFGEMEAKKIFFREFRVHKETDYLIRADRKHIVQNFSL
jgi:hypothetical protein